MHHTLDDRRLCAFRRAVSLLSCLILCFAAYQTAAAGEARALEPFCPGASAASPAVIFCDDFESGQPLNERYFEYADNNGSFIRAPGVGRDGSYGMRAQWQPGQDSAGSIKRSFGRVPRGLGYPSGGNSGQDFRDIYWRLYLKMEPGWTGSPDKLSRAVIFASETNWATAIGAHVWTPANRPVLMLDPATGIDQNSNLVTTTYNDFANLRWLGAQAGSTPLFSPENAGRWFCIESRVRLNDPGASNGVFELWIDNSRDAQLTGLNWVGNWRNYGINALFIENFWNDGAPGRRTRYIDNIVISTQRIGCISQDGAPATPRNLHFE